MSDRLRRRCGLSVCVLALVAAVSLLATPIATAKVKSSPKLFKVFEDPANSGEPAQLQIDVEGRLKQCVGRRLMNVYRREPAGPVLVFSGRTPRASAIVFGNGFHSGIELDHATFVKPGDVFFAQLPRKKTEARLKGEKETVICKAATSADYAATGV